MNVNTFTKKNKFNQVIKFTYADKREVSILKKKELKS